MRKIVRLGAVLSLVWVCLSLPSAYIFNQRSMREAADQLVTYCEAVHKNDYEYMKECRDDRDKLFEELSKNNLLQVTLFSLVPLPFIWLIAFFSLNAKNWIQRGS